LFEEAIQFLLAVVVLVRQLPVTKMVSPAQQACLARLLVMVAVVVVQNMFPLV
jgi:hypothetical protein